MRNRTITLIGTLASALTTRNTPGGTFVAEGSVAGTLEQYRADTGEKIGVPFYVDFSALGKGGENLARQGFEQGDALILVGEPDFQEWKNDVGGLRSTVRVKVLQAEKLNAVMEVTTDKNGSVRLLGGLNEVQLIGNLTADVELKNTKADGSGDAVANVRLGVNERWTSGGVPQEKAHYFNVTLWRENALMVAGLKKGDPLMVRGPLLRDAWTTAEGEANSRRYIEAETVLPLARRVVSEAGAARPKAAVRQAQAAPAAPLPTDGQGEAAFTPDVAADSEVPFTAF